MGMAEVFSSSLSSSSNHRQVKSRVGPEMKQDLLLFSWSWWPGMWTLRVAVAIGGMGVDANLRILQVPRSGWTIVERAASLNYAGKRHGVVQFAWELAECSA
ncbi:hypothetical protein Taro_015691 [Colocasia esculenta]|uniref:Uncharacterized protein n=1 Tax=Colocasia esculenta TaxID=4460 RepID=A0A843ULJ6_COLES|nr:hypothetical protein [Colocasia esculenta]